MVFNATFNNISVISWRSVLLVEEPGENHRPTTSHWPTLSHNVVSSTSRLSGIRTQNVSNDTMLPYDHDHDSSRISLRRHYFNNDKWEFDPINYQGVHVNWIWIIQHCITWKAWQWSIVGNQFGYYYAPCTIKTSFVDFEEEKEHCSRYKILNLASLPNSSYLSSASQKPSTRLTYSVPHFYAVFLTYILLNLFTS